jgi:hypothetical protein
VEELGARSRPERVEASPEAALELVWPQLRTDGRTLARSRPERVEASPEAALELVWPQLRTDGRSLRPSDVSRRNVA